jgi:hypothetical protein
MAIKSGQLIHVSNQVLLHRAQTAGPGTVNINRDKIYELGNYLSVGTVTDIPDLSFTLESFDTTAELEAILTGLIPVDDPNPAGTYAALPDGTSFKLNESRPMDVASVFKPGSNAGATKFDEIGSVAIPYLTLEQMSYRFGITDNASQQATLRGDTLLYTPGSTYIETFDATGAITLAHPAFPYNGDSVAGTRYALSVSLNSGERLSYGTDYTETVGAGTGTKAITIVLTNPPTSGRVQVIYASDVVAVYPQASHAKTGLAATGFTGPSPRPAAIRGRNIEVFVGGLALTNRWNSVQSVNVDYRVTLERDEEFSNSSIVAQDFDVPDVSGSIEIKPRDYKELYTKVRQIAGVPDGEVVGPLTTEPLNVDIVLHNPDITPAQKAAGAKDILKTIRIPDARFNFPGFQGRVQNKLSVTMDWSSDTGDLTLFKGEAPPL